MSGKIMKERTFVKIIIYKKMISTPFLTHKASNVKMFSQLSSINQYYTFMSPLFNNELCCSKPLLLLLVFVLSRAQKQ